MKTASMTLLSLMFLSSLGLWGCANQKNGATGARIQELEIRYAKMEQDYRAIVATNEVNRRKIGQLESQRDEFAHQAEDLKAAARERDEYRDQLAARTRERDGARTQLTQFSQDLQGLLQRVDTALNTTPATTVNAIPTARTSE